MGRIKSIFTANPTPNRGNDCESIDCARWRYWRRHHVDCSFDWRTLKTCGTLCYGGRTWKFLVINYFGLLFLVFRKYLIVWRFFVPFFELIGEKILARMLTYCFVLFSPIYGTSYWNFGDVELWLKLLACMKAQLWICFLPWQLFFTERQTF